MNAPPHQRPEGDPQEAELSQAVMRYLREHPHAMDTLEGIAQWWLPREKVRVEVSKLAQAIDRLVGDGTLQRIGSGESARYRLSK